jgi:predicted Zn finger-like uncharacterized protein
MILTCPECGTQYVVKDGAIPPAGRQVRCASCKHSWHQDPERAEEPASDLADEGAAPETAQPASAEEESGAETPAVAAQEEEQSVEEEPGYAAVASEPPGYRPLTAMPDPDYRQEHEAAAPDAASADAGTSGGFPADDDFAPFGPREYEEPRKRGRLLPLLLLILIVAAAATAFWFLAPPEWKAKLGLKQTEETPLQLMMTHRDRQKLKSGNELLVVTGRVINPTEQDQPVPPIKAQLLSKTGEVVYTWTIPSPARTLPPGASAPFNSAEVNVPAGGDQLTITLVTPPKV